MNRPFPGPYHNDGKFINDRAGILIAQVMGNSGVPAVSMTAALLAAAWDMREALELMLSHGERCNWFADRGDNEVCEQARAALAKAKGSAS